MISVIVSLVLFIAVFYVNGAKADGCANNNCASEEGLVTLPQADNCGRSAC